MWNETKINNWNETKQNGPSRKADTADRSIKHRFFGGTKPKSNKKKKTLYQYSPVQEKYQTENTRT